MTSEIRVCREDEQARAIEICNIAFSEGSHAADTEAFMKVMPAERTFAGFEGDTMMASGAAFPFEVTIPGGTLPAAGVTLIGVLPSHRRRGTLRRMMEALHRDAAERGEALAVLWASEESIYQRFGYGMSVRALALSAKRERIRYFEDSPPVGSTRLISIEEAPDVVGEIYDRVRRATPGMFRRSEEWWRHHRLYDPEHHRDGDGPVFCAVLEIAGTPEAYALYSVQSKWETSPVSKLHVWEAVATGPVATREVWRYIFGVDLIETVRAWWLPLDHPLQYLVTEPRRLGLSLRDSLWLRILNLPAAMLARGYATDDLVTLEVSDPMHPANAGTWNLDTTGDAATFAHTSDVPDLRLDIRDLGAAYLGGVRVNELFTAGRIEEVTEGAVDRFDRMMGTTVAPWCPEVF